MINKLNIVIEDNNNNNVSNLDKSRNKANVINSEIIKSKDNPNILSSSSVRNRRFTNADLIKFAVFIIFIIISIVIIAHYYPFFLSLKDPLIRSQWIDMIKHQGFSGLLISIGIQISQVIFAIIPGEPVEIAMGFLYGTFGGLAVCLFGILVGSIIILFIVRLLGISFINKFIKKETMDKLKFLHNSKSLDMVVFFLFLIPGTPKDILTYFIPLTSMKSFRFLMISTFARIPSVISSTLVGASLGSNKWGLSIFIFALTAIVGLIGIQLNNWYVKKQQATDNSKTN